MGVGICRMGDKNNAKQNPGAVISVPQSTVFLDGKLVAIVGSVLANHGDDKHHKRKFISEGDTTVICGGGAVGYIDCLNSCGHQMAEGSSTGFCKG